MSEPPQPSRSTSPITVLILAAIALLAATPAAATRAQDDPSLRIPTRIPATPGEAVVVPVRFAAAGHEISSLSFALDLPDTDLTLDPTDADDDGVPDAVTVNAPPGMTHTVFHTPDQPTSELKLVLFDAAPPFAVLEAGPILSITLEVAPEVPTTVEHPVRFSDEPPPSFGNTAGRSVPGQTEDGSVRIEVPTRTPGTPTPSPTPLPSPTSTATATATPTSPAATASPTTASPTTATTSPSTPAVTSTPSSTADSGTPTGTAPRPTATPSMTATVTITPTDERPTPTVTATSTESTGEIYLPVGYREDVSASH